MDERSHHQHPHGSQQAAGHGMAAPAPQQSPWPGQQAPAYGAPISGHAPFPGPAAPQQPYAYAQQQPQPAAASHHQFQYAASGFVMPGAPTGEAPMSAHGGTIGTPQHAPQHGTMPLLNGHDPHAAAQQYHQPGAVAPDPYADPYAQPQAWAFPTPQGLQLVHPDAVSHAPLAHQHASPALHAVAGAGTAHAVARRRMRWETIVPAAAVACLLAAIALFISDFDRITGRDAGAGAAPAAATSGGDAEATTEGAGTTGEAGAATDDAGDVVQEATALFEAGRFDEAANLLHPVLDSESPDPKAVALHDRVDAAAQRNRSLLAQLQRQRRASNWSAVLTTIGQLEQLRPLSDDLVKLRSNARTAATADRTVNRARAMIKQGRTSEAKALLERALKAGPNRRMQVLLEQLSARQAAPSTTRPAAARGGGARAAAPPASGGRPATSPSVRPPANVPAGAIPARPDAPNPVSSQNTGAAAVGGGGPAAGGGGGANCHTHDGVYECH